MSVCLVTWPRSYSTEKSFFVTWNCTVFNVKGGGSVLVVPALMYLTESTGHVPMQSPVSASLNIVSDKGVRGTKPFFCFVLGNINEPTDRPAEV